MVIKINESVGFEEVLDDPAGRKIVEMIEDIVDSTNPEIIRVRDLLIKELKDKFGYDYVL